MQDAFVENFLAAFDDSRFPADFLQRYELLECLSHSELGETLLVKDQQSGARFVAKCYETQALHSQISESELLKKLNHASLPAFVSEHRNAQMLCVVREFAPGVALDRLAREIPLSPLQAVDIVLQLCDILDYLHHQTPPVIHRDIKPQNVIIDRDGKVSLIDFGISRKYDERAQVDTLAYGTQFYAAPEQYGFSQTDGRSDIYSLGVLLGWLLTGRVEVREAKKEIADPRLKAVVVKCTAFAPEKRYANVGQVRDALTGRAARRRFLFLAGGALLAVALGVFAWLNLFPMGGVSFREPLIEAAARRILQKADHEPISPEELETITDLYIFGDQTALNEIEYTAHVQSFVDNDGTVHRGNIHALDDLVRFKNLRRLSLAYQEIEELTPLAGLAALEVVDLRHNPLADVSALAGLSSLHSLTIFDTQVADLRALKECPRLTTVDAGFSQIRSTAALAGLPGLRKLVMRKAPLQSLEQIETLPALEEIYLSQTPLRDLYPLLALPHLQLVEISEDMRPAAEALQQKAQFKIIYP